MSPSSSRRRRCPDCNGCGATLNVSRPEQEETAFDPIASVGRLRIMATMHSLRLLPFLVAAAALPSCGTGDSSLSSTREPSPGSAYRNAGGSNHTDAATSLGAQPTRADGGGSAGGSKAGGSGSDRGHAGGTDLHAQAGDARSPDCGDIPAGVSQLRVRFAAPHVPPGATCTPEAQSRVCANGELGSWTGSFQFDTCAEDAGKNCGSTPSGAEETRLRYADNEVAFGASCQHEIQTRTCQSGTWAAWSGTYTAETCSVRGPASCDSSPNGAQEARLRYADNEVAFGMSCQPEIQTRTCQNATWSGWSGTYTADSCSVRGPAACGSTQSGGQESRTRYAAAEVPFGDICQQETQTHTCQNGVWGDWSGTYAAETCFVRGPAACGSTESGGQESRTRYAAPEVPFGTTCQQETQTRTCQDGIWSAWSGSLTSKSCQVRVPRCGDGFVQSTEVCDDGNTTRGDGCDPLCAAIDPGFACVDDASHRSICTACVVLVRPGSADETGQQWQHAYSDLTKALQAADALISRRTCSDVSVWVGSGTYYGQFIAPGHVGLLGGFRGSEWSADQRDIRANVTVLSGDIAKNDASTDDRSDNAQHVLTLPGNNIVDGVAITGGHSEYLGGGILVYGSATLRNLVIEDNDADYGGGVAIDTSQDVDVENVRFSRNTARHCGGGLVDDYYATDAASTRGVVARDAQFEGNLAESGGGLCTMYRGVRIEHATFHGNEATVGAGARLGLGSAVLDRIDFINNRAGRNGGALYSDTELNVSNSRFWRNTAGEHGGAVYVGNYAQLVNVTMMANTAPAGAGGGIWSRTGSAADDHGWVYVYNSILWDNPGGETGGTGAFAIGDWPIRNCIKGWSSSTSNIACAVGTTPFVDPEGGDLRLHPLSAAIDAGINAVLESLPLDLAGAPRFSGAQVDLGAYEAAGSGP